jgi:purine-binding chemotaxis protein CheW
MSSEQLVVFRLASEEYAISIAQVKEIIRYSGATKLPNTPDHMEGIINLRGKVIPVLDLTKRLGVKQEKAGDKQAVIINSLGMEVGVVVDEVTEVLLLEDSAIELAPTVTQMGEFLRGIGKQEERLMIILDMDKLFSEEEKGLLQNVG